MSDISNQLIKDSFNYVLQSDIVTGIVYRIGGTIPVNPIFSSGLTINSGFTYSNGTEQNGYVLTCDSLGNAFWSPLSALTPCLEYMTDDNGNFITDENGNYILFDNQNCYTGLTYYVSASTPTGVTLYNGDRWFDTSTGAELVWINDGDSTQWVQISSGGGGGGGTDTYVTGLTINGNEIVLTQNRTDAYSSFTISLSGITGGTSGEYLPLSGGTVTGNTVFQSGLTANTVSATTYYNLPVSAVTNGTGISASTSNGTVTITNTAPDQTVTITGGTDIEITGTYPDFGINFTGTTDYLPLSGGTVTGDTIFQSGLTATTISATTYQNLPETFLRNQTNSGTTDTIHQYQSIFNPSNLTVLSSSTFVIEVNADYYVLGDLTNYGTIQNDGTLKIGGVLYNYGIITGTGIIE
jgi:hypothetical protein